MPSSGRMAVEINGMHAGKVVHPVGRQGDGGSSSTQREINQQLQQHTQATSNQERRHVHGAAAGGRESAPLSVNAGIPNKVGDDTSARLTWMDLWVSVTNGRGEIRTLLHGLTGYAEPGSMLAIMGPSGSGKTSLLDSLAGRLAKNATMKGDILVNGNKTKLSYGMAAYVTQQDDLIGTLTVQETIHYSANLRLPDHMPKGEKRAIVESTIIDMGLQDCANTPIGNWHLRGLSGGERRRVSIALEILTRPRMLFLDEPTSGLDSASAFFVITTLKNLARDGRTVIASIHQPCSEVFDLFDNLFLLSHGQTIFFGEAAAANEHFSASGFPCPPLRNPADHFLRAVNADFDRVKATLKGSFKIRDFEAGSTDPLDRMTTKQVVKILTESFLNSEFHEMALAHVLEINQIEGPNLESSASKASFFCQSFILTQRSFVNMSRDIGYYWLRLVVYIFLTLCIGTIYFKVGTSSTSIMGRAGCMSYIAGFLTFMSIGGFPSFVEDMKVFSHERLNGHYGVAAFVIGNSLSSMPFLFLISWVSGSICYFMVDLHSGWDHFAYFVLMLFACVACVESLMMVVASIVPNFLMGIITGAGIQGIFLLVAGFFRLRLDLPKPVWRYPMSYISFHTYALQGMYQNDFLGLIFQNAVVKGKPVGPPITGLYVVENLYEIQTSRSKWVDLAIVFGMVIGYRITFFLMIKFKEKVKPMLHSLISRCRNWNCCTCGRSSGSSNNHSATPCSRSCLPLQNPPPPVVLASPSPLNDRVPLRYFSDRMNVNIADHQAHGHRVKCSWCQVQPKENHAAQHQCTA